MVRSWWSAWLVGLVVRGVDDLTVLETPLVVELLELLAQRDELIEVLSAELGVARVRIAELETWLG